MLKERKVGKWFRIEGRIMGERVRLALRTQNRENARNTINEIERTLAEGAASPLWPKLRSVLPEKSFERLAATVGYIEAAGFNIRALPVRDARVFRIPTRARRSTARTD
jgi:hypothetical protein